MIDLHTHILPGIDDGPVDWAESLSLAQALQDAGVTEVAATSHIKPPIWPNIVPGQRFGRSSTSAWMRAGSSSRSTQAPSTGGAAPCSTIWRRGWGSPTEWARRF